MEYGIHPNVDQKILPFQNKDPMYTCSLEGCKSAWGSASEMYNHLTSSKNKHNKSYLTKYYEIPNLTVDQIFNKSRQVFEEKKTENNNRVDVNIKQVSNHMQYKDLKNRDLNWSEKTARREKWVLVLKEFSPFTRVNICPCSPRSLGEQSWKIKRFGEGFWWCEAPPKSLP